MYLLVYCICAIDIRTDKLFVNDLCDVNSNIEQYHDRRIDIIGGNNGYLMRFVFYSNTQPSGELSKLRFHLQKKYLSI